MSKDKFQQVQAERDLHLENEDWDHFNCITCFNYNKQLEELDSSKIEYEAFISENRGKLILLPDKNNLAVLKLGVRQPSGEIEVSKFQTSWNDFSIYKYLEGFKHVE